MHLGRRALVLRCSAVRRTSSAVLLLAAVAVGAAGCGSDDEGDDAAAEAPTPTVAAADANFCDAFGAIIVGPLDDPGTDVRDPTVLSSAVELTRELLVVLVAGAPPEVADAAGEFADSYVAGFDIWEAYGYDLARVAAEATPEQQAMLEAFLEPPQGPGEIDPLDTLQDYFFAHCAADVTLPDDILPSSTTAAP